MKRLVVIVSILLLPLQVWATEFPLHFTDGSGKEITIQKKPTRVVSMVPSITEILLRIGAKEPLKGITYHSVLPHQTAGKEIIGGFFRPDLDKVASLQPDLIFYADVHKDMMSNLASKAQRINLSPNSIAGTFEHIALLGQIFEREEEAAAIIAEQQHHLEVIRKKVDQIPANKRVRVMRLMGRSTLMAPGDDSFQNDYIRAAGGIAPEFCKNGNSISVSLDQWQQFNPQVVYGCGGDRQALTILDQPGWKDVEAVKNNRVYFFPCALTCRAASNGGYFVSWLAARIYGQEFGQPENFVLPEQVVARKPFALNVNYINKAEIVTSGPVAVLGPATAGRAGPHDYSTPSQIASQANRPTTPAMIRPGASVFLSTLPSCPASPAVLQPTINFAGASMEPRAPPVVWAARITATLMPSSSAACCCKGAKTTFELVLLPVMNAPSMPM